ncbi:MULTISPECIES: TetR/AcrR family transcriptional regulator [Amycolatopsis]|uniref:DNA-binding transcriptional regulator, AcrR family n=2 Tax=Amycolatopsis TaxID=1813 RepID=A0A1I3Y6D2_9PSEU|nr:TetR/AcrR family transcriptional regulator [Amycolatopsis sacchari]SFK27323.1 DNA-binding transcriptional regulator, AcrR family [Amycolatopsis sacchari]
MEPTKRRTPTGAAVLRQDLTDSIVDAALDELAEKGYRGLSMDAVARRAGVGKSALYRRWPSKLEMAVSIVAALGVPLADVPDKGSFREDVRALLDAVQVWFEDPRLGPIFVDLLGVARQNEALGHALTEHLGEPRRAHGLRIVERAIERGELPADLDRELALDVFAAPVFWRLHVRREPVTAEYLDQVADLVVKAFR